MGPSSDPSALVDLHLKVHGFENLRVVDTYLMPIYVNANTYAVTLTIAEKGASMIRDDWMKFHHSAAFRITGTGKVWILSITFAPNKNDAPLK
jgi:choline dehydrogenase-like flavoprotein